MAINKTNAMRILDKNKIKYNMIEYDISDGKIDGVSVAEKTNQSIEEVFKTLVVQGNSKAYYVFVVPVAEELDLKKASKITKEKKIEMINITDLLKVTGYIRGGCSPVGMKKLYKTYIHISAELLDTICISGGKKGLQIRLNPKELITIINGKFDDIIH